MIVMLSTHIKLQVLFFIKILCLNKVLNMFTICLLLLTFLFIKIRLIRL